MRNVTRLQLSFDVAPDDRAQEPGLQLIVQAIEQHPGRGQDRRFDGDPPDAAA